MCLLDQSFYFHCLVIQLWTSHAHCRYFCSRQGEHESSGLHLRSHIHSKLDAPCLLTPFHRNQYNCINRFSSLCYSSFYGSQTRCASLHTTNEPWAPLTLLFLSVVIFPWATFDRYLARIPGIPNMTCLLMML